MSNAASFSRVMSYEKCPASYEWQYVLGNKEAFDPGPAAMRGTLIHKSIEDYFLHDAVLHEEIPAVVKGWLQRYREDVLLELCTAHPEFTFALTKEWTPTTFDADDAYIRGFMDNMFVYPDRVVIHEYKTGQEYDEHVHQKQLYAMVGMLLFPTLSEIEVIGIYIDGKKQTPTKYSRHHLHSMQYTWDRRIAKMSLPLYPARPGMHCRWCPKSKKKGGICPVG